MKRFIVYLSLTLIGFPMLYFLIAFILGHTPVNNNFKTDSTGVEIFVKSNGVHTDFVIPIQNEICNWKDFVSVNQTLAKDSAAKFIAVGWGNKDFFLKVDEWKNLSLKIAFRALFLPNETAMHVTFKNNLPITNEDCKKMKISAEQYKVLVKYIHESFKTDSTGKPILIEGAHYHERDAFYEANGHYSLFKTCNEWTRKGMKTTGMRCAAWSVLDKSVLRFMEE